MRPEDHFFFGWYTHFDTKLFLSDATFQLGGIPFQKYSTGDHTLIYIYVYTLILQCESLQKYL